MPVIWLALGAVVGALIRYSAQTFLWGVFPSLPWGTILVNVSGCFIAGILLPFLPTMPEHIKVLVFTGFLGSLTTMSAFAAESFQMLSAKSLLQFGFYWAVGAFGSIIFCAAGFWLSQILWSR